MDEIEIFRPGTHTDTSCRRLNFSREDVAAIAAGYDPARFGAPVVVGHPKTDDPAFGWVKGLELRDDGVLIARTDKVAPEFAAAVKDGRYKKVSASFYLPDHPNNPTPGRYYLRHVGFLGAAAPAVKGLKPVELSADESQTVTVEFDEHTGLLGLSLTRLLRRLRDLLVEKMGAEAADRALPDTSIEEIDSLSRRQLAQERMATQTSDNAATPPAASEDIEFAETAATRALNAALEEQSGEDTSRAELVRQMSREADVTTGTINAILRGEITGFQNDPVIRAMARVLGVSFERINRALPERGGDDDESSDNAEESDVTTSAIQQLDAVKRENARLKAQTAAFAEQQAAARKAETDAFLDGLVKAGKLAPGLKADVATFMEALEAEETAMFAQGAEKTPLDFFKDLLGKANPVIDFAERSAGAGTDPGKRHASLAEITARRHGVKLESEEAS